MLTPHHQVQIEEQEGYREHTETGVQVLFMMERDKLLKLIIVVQRF